MPLGGGKYDKLVEQVYRESGAEKNAGLVLVIVLDGKSGDGFSCKGDGRHMMKLPHLLRIVADSVERDQANLVNEMANELERRMADGSQRRN